MTNILTLATIFHQLLEFRFIHTSKIKKLVDFQEMTLISRKFLSSVIKIIKLDFVHISHSELQIIHPILPL